MATLAFDVYGTLIDTDGVLDRLREWIGSQAEVFSQTCQVCTRNRVEKARSIGLTDDELNALIAVTSAVNSGVTAATARVAFGILEEENTAECGEVCSANPQ